MKAGLQMQHCSPDTECPLHTGAAPPARPALFNLLQMEDPVPAEVKRTCGEPEDRWLGFWVLAGS